MRVYPCNIAVSSSFVPEGCCAAFVGPRRVGAALARPWSLTGQSGCGVHPSNVPHRGCYVDAMEGGVYSLHTL